MVNYYDILELENFASVEEVKTAHRRLSKKYHPDLNNGDVASEEKFKEIQNAYEHLRDPEAKKVYDDAYFYFLSEPYKQFHGPYVETPRPKHNSGFSLTRFPVILVVFLLFRLLRLGCNESQDWPAGQKVTFNPPATTVDTAFNKSYFTETPVAQQQYFQIGDSYFKVQEIQGKPSDVVKLMESEIWSYGNSTVVFKNGVVTKFTNNDGNLHVQ